MTRTEDSDERIAVVAVGDSFVPRETFERALAEEAPSTDVRATQLDETVRWQPAPGAPKLREFAGTPEQVIAAIGDAEALLVHVAPITREVLAAAPRLRMLGVARGGPVNVDLEAATELGIPVVTTPGRNAQAVAELTLSLAVAVARNVLPSLEFARRSPVLGASAIEGAPFVGAELRGRTFGLVGFGQVGVLVAGLARAYGARVLVHDPFVSEEAIREHGAEPVALEQLLAEADVVSLHARATPETENLMNAERFALMKRGAIFINTARETLVDEAALLAALESGALAGAGLDVVRPTPDGSQHPLTEARNCIVLPHIGGATEEAGMNGARRLARAVAALARGEELPNVVNAKALEGRATA